MLTCLLLLRVPVLNTVPIGSLLPVIVSWIGWGIRHWQSDSDALPAPCVQFVGGSRSFVFGRGWRPLAPPAGGVL